MWVGLVHQAAAGFAHWQSPFLKSSSGYSAEGERSGWVTHRLFEPASRIIIRVNAPRRLLQEFIFQLRQRTPALLSPPITRVGRLALRARYSGTVLRKFAGLLGLSLPLRGRRVGVGSPTARDVPREGFLGHAAFSGLDRLALAPRLVVLVMRLTVLATRRSDVGE
jgi:hypothetical protein